MDGVYTNKAPGGIAYRCSFRVTEAAYLIERAVDVLALELKMDPVELRRKNFIAPDKFPYASPLGWSYDSGNYDACDDKSAGHGRLRRVAQGTGGEARKRRADGHRRLQLSSKLVGAGPAHTFDIAGIKMFDSAEIRVHPTGKAICRMGTKSQGQGHETTYAQIVAAGAWHSGRRCNDGRRRHRHRSLWPGNIRQPQHARLWRGYGHGGAKDPRQGQKDCGSSAGSSEEDLEWEPGKFFVKGAPGKSKTIQDIAFAAYTNMPQGLEAGLGGGRLL